MQHNIIPTNYTSNLNVWCTSGQIQSWLHISALPESNVIHFYVSSDDDHWKQTQYSFYNFYKCSKKGNAACVLGTEHWEAEDTLGLWKTELLSMGLHYVYSCWQWTD